MIDNCHMKNILILGYKDTPLQGHALSVYKKISSKCNAQIICYVATGNDKDVISFCNSHGKGLSRVEYWIQRIRAKRQFLLSKRMKQKDTDEYCFFNPSFYYAKNAKQILKKATIQPDMIIICLHDFFTSPKTINELYQQTKAQIIVLMCDPNIMTGGCHYPIECKGYQSNCNNCPVLLDKGGAGRMFSEKLKYLKEIPLILVGTSYDLNRAKLSPILSDKKQIKWLTLPPIPFVSNKETARQEFGISNDDFVVIAGGGALDDKRKGFNYIFESLKSLNKEISGSRRVTFLLLGNDKGETLDFGDKIKVIRPGFLKLEGLLNAFYASDVFCSSSVDDTGPYMIVYSVACGVPVISFPVGQAVDLVLHKKTGYMADYKQSDSIKDGLLMFYNMTKEEWGGYSNNCKQLCEEIKNTEPWYDQLLKL